MRSNNNRIPQYTTYNEIVHLHWCSICLGNLSTNLVLLIALAIGLGRHLDEATYTDK